MKYKSQKVAYWFFAFIILGLSFLKFIGVAFYFMELKKANSFWKVLLICFLGLLFLVVALIHYSWRNRI